MQVQELEGYPTPVVRQCAEEVEGEVEGGQMHGRRKYYTLEDGRETVAWVESGRGGNGVPRGWQPTAVLFGRLPKRRQVLSTQQGAASS